MLFHFLQVVSFCMTKTIYNKSFLQFQCFRFNNLAFLYNCCEQLVVDTHWFLVFRQLVMKCRYLNEVSVTIGSLILAVIVSFAMATSADILTLPSLIQGCCKAVLIFVSFRKLGSKNVLVKSISVLLRPNDLRNAKCLSICRLG